MLARTVSDRLRRVFSRTAPSDPRPVGDSMVAETQREFFEANGYLILPGFFSKEEMRALKAHLDGLWASRAGQGRAVIDSYFGLPNAVRTHFRKVDDDVRKHPYKLLDLHLDDEVIREVCTARPLVRVLRNLLGSTPLVCNSLLFERGSQQDAHFDTFFMPSKTRNMMAASWVAIDPVTPQSGPLYYYPKSHLIEPYTFSHGKINAVFSELGTGAAAHIERIIAEHDLRREVFQPEQGDVLIWHAQLLHGGSAIEDPSATRCSLVTHYWTELDFPDPAQRLELDDERWILRREPQHVEDGESFAEVDAYLASQAVTEEMLAAVPASFDARLYLVRNQDLMRAGANPWDHYVHHGRAEGRVW